MKIKLNSIIWMVLRSSVVIFQALEPMQPLQPLQPQQPQWPQQTLQPHFIRKNTDPDGLIIPGTQMTNTSAFYWNWSSKIQNFTDIWTHSVGGCWGQLMLLFSKLVDETKIYETPEATKHHNSLELLILLHVRANLLCTLQCETPCIINLGGGCQNSFPQKPVVNSFF